MTDQTTMRVVTLRQHLNDVGEHFIGDEYDIERRHGERLIANGVVEFADPAFVEHDTLLNKFAHVGTARSAPQNKRRAKAPSAKP